MGQVIISTYTILCKSVGYHSKICVAILFYRHNHSLPIELYHIL